MSEDVPEEDGRAAVLPASSKAVRLVYYMPGNAGVPVPDTKPNKNWSHEENVVFLILLAKAYEEKLFNGTGAV